MDIRVGKSFSEAQSDEHLRKWSNKRWDVAKGYGSYDRTRSALNFEIVRGKVVPLVQDKSIPERIKESLESRGIKDPNEGLTDPKFRTIVNIIFGGSRDRMHQLAYGEQHVNLNRDADNSAIKRCEDIEKWALDVYRFAADKWGEENIASFVVHLDETNPHCHCTLLPIKENKFAFKKIFCGKDLYGYKDYMRQLHDEFAKVNEKWGLARGENAATHAKRNIPPHQYREMLNRQCADLESQIENDTAVLRQLRFEVAHAEKRVKGLNTMIANLEARQTEMETEMLELANEIKAGKGDSEELQRAIDRLGVQHRKVLESLTDKRQKLVEANRRLEEFRLLEEQSREKAGEYREQAEAYRNELRDISHDRSMQVQYRIANAMIGDVIHELKETLPKMSDEERSRFDSTLLDDLAERGEEIFKCAGMLLAGYVDAAVSFAEAHGGGGSSPGGGWGKDDDESEYHFARRCLAMAANMTRPRFSKPRKRK